MSTIHLQWFYPLFRPLRQIFSGGVFQPAVLAMALTVGCCFPAAAQTPYPQPVADPLLFEYGPQLPLLRGAAVNGSIPTMQASPAGDGGWLTAWTEQADPSGVRTANLPLKVRIQLKSLEEDVIEGWPDEEAGLPAIVTVGTADLQDLFRTTAGPGGAWLTWQESGKILTRWFDGKTGIPAGPALQLNTGNGPASLVCAPGDGNTAWVVWTSPVEGVGVVGSGAVLELSAGETKVRARFTFPSQFEPLSMAAANSGNGLFRAWPASSGADYSITTIKVSADGMVGEQVAAELGIYRDDWIGIVPWLTGYYAIWGRYYSGGPTLLLQGRALSAEGGWAPNSKVDILGPVPVETFDGLAFFTGPASAILYCKSPGATQSWLMSPGQAPTPLPNDFSTPWGEGRRSYSLGAFPRILALDTGDNRDTLISRRIYQESQRTVTTAISEGIGQQSSLSLAWNGYGLQAVFQEEGYDPAGMAGLVTGYNKRAGASGGAVIYEGFSSPAQAWSLNRQLLTYRRRGTPETFGSTGPDDVMGVISTLLPDGSLVQDNPPFVIAGGQASQRGVAVAAHDVGTFLAAWREETGSLDAGDYVATVRAAFIGADGMVSPPGGRVLDISTRELSAVGVAGAGFGSGVVWRSAQTANPKRNEIRLVSVPRLINSTMPKVVTVSPASHDAVGPQALPMANGFCVVWRDKRTDRIYACPDGLNPGEPIPVSAVGQFAREPALASTSLGRVAILWLEQGGYSVSRVMMSVMDYTGAVTQPVQVASGYFDPNLLTATGDGERVAFGLRDQSSAAAGLRIFIVTPTVSRQGGLKLEVAEVGAAGAEAKISWDTSAVFPGVAETVETSADLLNWKPVTGLQTVPVPLPVTSDSSGRSTLSLPVPAGDARRYFRLKAALK